MVSPEVEAYRKLRPGSPEALRALRRLPKAERSQILRESAAKAVDYYASDPEVLEWLNADLGPDIPRSLADAAE